MAKGKKKRTRAVREVSTENYRHPEATSPLRPEVGTQAQFRKKKPPQEYRYDSSLAPELQWDSQNPAREEGEALIKRISDLSAELTKCSDKERPKLQAELVDASEKLKKLSKPFLNWAGKAERLSFEVPTLPLFVHERLSTAAIVETLRSHKRDKQIDMFDLFGDPQHSVTDQVLKAYEYQDKWVNRMVLGDSLVVMNSLLRYEGLGGQVQMIYIDPPYGVKFGSNFQPFVRKRDVGHNDDENMTREPEMVKAYRDTWQLGLHSYLTYMRDRLLLARELLSATGSVFVQISDENVHHLREVMDEVFGEENFVALITFKKRTSATADYLGEVNDYLLWYGKDYTRLKYRQLFERKLAGGENVEHYSWIEDPATSSLTRVDEMDDGDVDALLRKGYRLVAYDSLMTAERGGNREPFSFKGRMWNPGEKNNWKTSPEGLKRLAQEGRVIISGNTLRYKRYLNDFSALPLTTAWADTTTFAQRIYSVQTIPKVVQRCLLMTTDPGDLVLDPTCGSGTTAYVAEEWGRRWITIDTSRVPLALARQRILTATFPYYDLKEEGRGPVGGFVYKRKQNSKGEEVGGIVPHVTLKSIANDETPEEEVLVDRPEEVKNITRVSGPFCVEATIPTPVDWEGDGEEDSGAGAQESYGSFVERMLEILRKSPVLHLDGGKTIQFRNVRQPAKTLSLSAEAYVDATAPGQKLSLPEAIDETEEKHKNMLPLSQKHVALVFGPENGAVSEKLVYEAAKEAAAKSYSHLYVIGFAIQANARQLVDNCENVMGISATYVQATPDLMMGDLLKNMRSSQIFSVCGLPEIKVKQHGAKSKEQAKKYTVELVGLDVFDPVTMQTEHRKGDDVPAWFLDTDYNDKVFHVSQAFFPRTSAWDNLKRALKASYEESVWDHLAGTTSAPFEAGEHQQIAVKVIDDRGNELLVVKKLDEANS